MNTRIVVPATTLVPYLSASQLSTYLRCGKQYQFRYIYKAKATHQGVALPFGSTWGITLAHWLQESSPTQSLPAAELATYFNLEFDRLLENAFTPVVFGKGETAESLKETASRMLDVFVETVPPPEEVLDIEKAFSVMLVHPFDDQEELPVPFVGAMDALVVLEGKPVIWEFKSSAKKYSVSQFDLEMIQPVAYKVGARVFELEDIPVDVIVTTKTKKPDVQVKRLTRTTTDEVQLYELAENVLRAVEAGVFPRNRSWACAGCGFREACDR